MSAKSSEDLELVANIWPIVDASSNLIQRVAARAYALPAGNDHLISTVLTALAPTDFYLAKQFPIDRSLTTETKHGVLSGTVSLSVFGSGSDTF